MECRRVCVDLRVFGKRSHLVLAAPAAGVSARIPARQGGDTSGSHLQAVSVLYVAEPLLCVTALCSSLLRSNKDDVVWKATV